MVCDTMINTKLPCAIFGDYLRTSNRSRSLVSDKLVDHSDVVGAAPTGASSSFLT